MYALIPRGDLHILPNYDAQMLSLQAKPVLQALIT